jgi:hypothetical protein
VSTKAELTNDHPSGWDMDTALFPQIDWRTVEITYPDGTPAVHMANEIWFDWFDLGVFERTGQLVSFGFKVKRYRSYAVLSVSRLKTPEGAAGPSGDEAIAHSPEHLQDMVTAMFAGEWETVFPEPMVQENRSTSIRGGEEVTRFWSAPTRTVGNALEGMGFSRRVIPFHEFKAREKELVTSIRPGLEVTSRLFPELGNLYLEGQLPDGNWVVERSFDCMPGEVKCERRMVVSPDVIGEIVGYDGREVSPIWATSSTNLGYAMKTRSDPRHCYHQSA